MSETKKSRGAGPRDKILFASKNHRKLSLATEDLCYLMERGYSESAALRVVGDHFQLQKRQRLAILRSSSGVTERQERESRKVSDLQNATLDIDGFNLIILLEAAYSGGLILHGADNCLRDLSSVHGTYKLVQQTPDSIEKIGHYISNRGVTKVYWWLDSPISNSGKLSKLILSIAEKNQWNWFAETTPYVDKIVAQSENVVVSSDKVILQRCQRWCNLGYEFVSNQISDAWFLKLPIKNNDAIKNYP